MSSGSRRILGILFASVFVVAADSQALAEDPLNLLFFGNSFTIYNKTSGKVGLLAQADGHPAPTIVADLAGGTDLDYHIREAQRNPQNNVANSAIGAGTWDYVVMQGYSSEATHLGDPTDFRADMAVLYGLVRNSSHGGTVKGIGYETWARWDLVPGTFDTMADMQGEIHTNYEAAVSDIQTAYGASSARMAGVGDAFEDRDFETSLYDAAGYHPSVAGSLLASMVIYRTIYSEDVSDIDYANASRWAGVNEATWYSLAATADAQPVPEPTTMGLLTIGAAALYPRRRRTSL